MFKDVIPLGLNSFFAETASTESEASPPNLASARVLRFGPRGLFLKCKHYEDSEFIDEGADYSSFADGRLSSSQFCSQALGWPAVARRNRFARVYADLQSPSCFTVPVAESRQRSSDQR